MIPATELATIPLTSGATIEDADSPAGKVWRATLDTISQQDGFQKVYWGREVENPSILELFVGKVPPFLLLSNEERNPQTDTRDTTLSGKTGTPSTIT